MMIRVPKAQGSTLIQQKNHSRGSDHEPRDERSGQNNKSCELKSIAKKIHPLSLGIAGADSLTLTISSRRTKP